MFRLCLKISENFMSLILYVNIKFESMVGFIWVAQFRVDQVFNQVIVPGFY